MWCVTTPGSAYSNPSVPANGYRVYGRNDERHLQFIVKAKRLGYTLQEIEILLRDTRKDCSRCPSARHILSDWVTHNR